MPSGCKLIKIYSVGYCIGRGMLADRSLDSKKRRFYTRCFLIKHPKQGLILVDTGYGNSLLELTKKRTYSLYSLLLPFSFSNQESLRTQLANDGISLSDLSYLVITHYHPDHIGALPEFAEIPWIYRKDTLETLLSFSLLNRLRNGFMRPLVPSVPKRSIPIYKETFSEKWQGFLSYDLFSDGSLYLINLPGHALGQMGLMISEGFFVADATWGGSSLPHPLGLFIQQNIRAYRETFHKIQSLPPSIKIYPTHTISPHE